LFTYPNPMKKYLSLLIIALCFFSCKKESPDTTALNASLAGKWELSSTSAGTSGQILTVQPGNGNIYQFNGDGSYARYAGSLKEDSGTYTVQENVQNVFGSKGDIITFSGTKSTFVLKLSGDSMVLTGDYTNAIGSGYTKLP